MRSIAKSHLPQEEPAVHITLPPHFAFEKFLSCRQELIPLSPTSFDPLLAECKLLLNPGTCGKKWRFRLASAIGRFGAVTGSNFSFLNAAFRLS
jgi:hypothetical protein